MLALWIQRHFELFNFHFFPFCFNSFELNAISKSLFWILCYISPYLAIKQRKLKNGYEIATVVLFDNSRETMSVNCKRSTGNSHSFKKAENSAFKWFFFSSFSQGNKKLERYELQAFFACHFCWRFISIDFALIDTNYYSKCIQKGSIEKNFDGFKLLAMPFSRLTYWYRYQWLCFFVCR